jgi:hypothetical protein
MEVQQHTNVAANDPKIRERYAYRYDLADQGLVPIDQGADLPSFVRRYAFDISNVDIADTRGYAPLDGSPPRLPGENRIRLYLAEVPEDNPEAPPVFRMAEVVVNINDDVGVVSLTPADFLLMP